MFKGCVCVSHLSNLSIALLTSFSQSLCRPTSVYNTAFLQHMLKKNLMLRMAHQKATQIFGRKVFLPQKFSAKTKTKNTKPK